MNNFIEQNSVNGKNELHCENTNQSNHGVAMPQQKQNKSREQQHTNQKFKPKPHKKQTKNNWKPSRSGSKQHSLA